MILYPTTYSFDIYHLQFLLVDEINMRYKMAFTYLLSVFGSILGIICTVCELSLYIRILTAVIIGISSWFILKYSRCPYCNKYGIRIHPFPKKELVCKYCGKKL